MANMIKLSKVSKLDGILSWSLQARDTCPGSMTAQGVLVDACAGCYAVGGNYNFPNVIAPREFNRIDWKREDWVEDMVKTLSSQMYFRWFDSGDIYHPDLALKILDVIRLTPRTSHWLPTRSHKVAKIAPTLAKIALLPNVMVRYSSDFVDGTYTPGLHGSTIVPVGSKAPEGVTACLSYLHEGKCDGCRACWSKDVPVIGYQAHGKVMLKVIRIKREAATA